MYFFSEIGKFLRFHLQKLQLFEDESGMILDLKLLQRARVWLAFELAGAFHNSGIILFNQNFQQPFVGLASISG
jgi:hypothetical protein